MRDVRRNIFVLGGSAGALEALKRLVGALPGDLPAALLVTVHTSSGAPGLLGSILNGAGPLPAANAEDGDPLEMGRIYVAPPDRHLLVHDHRVSVIMGPKENRHRPAIDPLFRSAARSHGASVAAVVLSGTLDDGSAGLEVVKACGGMAVVQDPRDAQSPQMPLAALERVPVDHCLPVREIALLLVSLATAPGPETRAEEEEPPKEPVERLTEREDRPAGSPSGLTCPDCNGALWRVEDGQTVRYRCRVGHGFTEDILLASQTEALEAALWTALRVLEERAELLRRMLRRVEGQPNLEMTYRAALGEVQEQIRLLRRALVPEAEGA